ncbi:D-alanyl-D-alanine carboxypeptidase family protein [Frondihabitans sp. VKM Ac-2883]|uniref:M15 family metallopeptidase n=1 Tax=Frondihabitans sp. VKM Ac-2883 TaxID=2783823 RepID=UPI00188A3380|nr:M15 family metallopeptidase [Frondihabitans sp. VKM Ac-2883]MBF4574551.1 M15 family metallopeptidase [Frondihabitans sp. VKM Ac-2883]
MITGTLEPTMTSASRLPAFTTPRRVALLAVALLLAFGLVVGTSATPAHAWGGYTNGKIPLSKLIAIPNGYLRIDAAAGYGSMNKAFKKKFGKELGVSEGYRSYDKQVSIWNARYVKHSKKVANSVAYAGKYWTKKKNVSVAAVPGTSVHGWALAVDLNSGVQTAGSAQKRWADKYGPKYGWKPVGNNFGEPWHFEFTPVKK